MPRRCALFSPFEIFITEDYAINYLCSHTDLYLQGWQLSWKAGPSLVSTVVCAAEKLLCHNRKAYRSKGVLFHVIVVLMII